MKKLLFVIFALLLVTFLPTTSAVGTPCIPQATSPRAEGLISTPTITSNFSNSTGTCVVDPAKAPFAPFKIPTYDDLKSIYYDQSKAAKVSLANWWTDPIAAETVYYRGSDLEVNSTYPVRGSGVGVFFVDGNLFIKTDITFGSPTEGVVFVVKGDIIIEPSVTRVDAVLMSQGTIYTAGGGCATSSVNVGSNALLINGNLISLDATKPIKLCRSLSNNTSPAERVVAQPKYLVILRDIFSETYQKWSEIP